MPFSMQRLTKNVLILTILLFINHPSFSQINKDVKFTSSDPDITLSATITLAKDHSISSAVVLLPVAGPTDRDLSLGNHKYYKVLADGLAKKGIASIRYDDRGVGQSEGEFLEANLQDRTKDACKAMKFLRSELSDIKYFGFIGMSEGAGISILASQLCDSISFMVLLSLPVREGRIEMENQMSRLLEISYFTDEQKKEIKKEGMSFLKLAASTDSGTKRTDILNIMKGKYGSVILPPYQFVPKTPEAKTEFVLSPWYQSQLKYNIQDPLKNSDIPMFALYGDLDKAIDPTANADLLRELSPETSIIELKGMNHLMQEAKTGSPMEYLMLPSSFSTEVVDLISSWINEL